MSKEYIRYRDAYRAGFCGALRKHIEAYGMDWVTFVRTGYSVEELHDIFGKDHPILRTVIESKHKHEAEK